MRSNRRRKAARVIRTTLVYLQKQGRIYKSLAFGNPKTSTRR